MFWNILKNLMKNLKKHNFALISETAIRDRAKWKQIWDHMYCQ